mgnify:CR=1 FL=1
MLIFTKFDASIKVDSCEVPSKLYEFYTYISKKYIIQVHPSIYPDGNSKAGYFNNTFFKVDGYFLDGIYKITGSIIYVCKDTVTKESDIYSDAANPIICKYWYVDM